MSVKIEDVHKALETIKIYCDAKCQCKELSVDIIWR